MRAILILARCCETVAGGRTFKDVGEVVHRQLLGVAERQDDAAPDGVRQQGGDFDASSTYSPYPSRAGRSLNGLAWCCRSQRHGVKRSQCVGKPISDTLRPVGGRAVLSSSRRLSRHRSRALSSTVLARRKRTTHRGPKIRES